MWPEAKGPGVALLGCPEAFGEVRAGHEAHIPFDQLLDLNVLEICWEGTRRWNAGSSGKSQEERKCGEVACWTGAARRAHRSIKAMQGVFCFNEGHMQVTMVLRDSLQLATPPYSWFIAVAFLN